MSDFSLDQGAAKLLPAVKSIAREAGQVILRYYTDTVSAHVKSDGSPVTAADHAAEAVILPALHHLTPNIPVISEEDMPPASLQPAITTHFGWSIRWTARAASSSTPMNSPSISDW